jgi:hypothetical protein
VAQGVGSEFKLQYPQKKKKKKENRRGTIKTLGMGGRGRGKQGRGRQWRLMDLNNK